MKKALIFLSILCISVIANNVSASHINGVEISYSAIDTLKYKFTFSLYRDCRGIAMPPWTVNVRALDKSISQSAGTMQTSGRVITDITPVCATQSSCGSSSNQGYASKGIERHTYTMEVDFNTAPLNKFVTGGACWVRIETSQNARGGSITTGPNGTLYSYADVNICLAPDNATPSFNDKPISILCCQEPAHLSVGGSDYIDGDSLSFSFGKPMRGYNQFTTFTSGYAYNNPFQVYYPGSLKFPYVNTQANPPIGIYLNPSTGDLTFTPTKCDEVTVAVIEVKEWRKINGKYEHIGTIRRDMMYTIEQCPANNTPEFIGPTEITLKANQCDSMVSFLVEAKDRLHAAAPNIKDSVELFYSQGPAGSTMDLIDSTALNPIARITWKPDQSAIAGNEKVIFTIRAKDNACPFNAIAEKSYLVNLIKDTLSAEIGVSVFEDKDKNCSRANSENSISNRSILGYRKNISDPSISIITDSTTKFSSCRDAGEYFIKLMEHPFYSDVCGDTLLDLKPLQKHEVNFGTNLKSNSVSGRVLADFNLSCDEDKGEKGMSGIKIKATPGNYTATTDAHGGYVLPLPNGKYTIQLADPLYKESCSSSHEVTISNNQVKDEDFFITRDSGNVKLIIDAQKGIRIGRFSYIDVMLINDGKQGVNSIGYALEHHPDLVIQETPTNVIVNDSLAYFYELLEPYRYKSFQIQAMLSSSSYKTGDSLYLKAHILTQLPDSLDVFKSDNQDSSYAIVTTSVNSNIKTTIQPQIVTAFDHTIDYTIHFQNTGTNAAHYVEVRDTLPESLDETTLSFVGASHPGMHFILQDRILYCIFDQIYLHSEQSFADGSTGFVKFNINQKEHFKKKTEIINSASIYFDLSEPVKTSDQVNIVSSPFEIDTVAKRLCAFDSLTVKYKVNYQPKIGEVLTLEISDVQGDFSNATELAKVPYLTSEGEIKIEVPGMKGNGYRLRMYGDDPLAITFEESYSNAFEIEKFGVSEIAISNDKICAEDEIDIEVVDKEGVEYRLMNGNQQVAKNTTGVFNDIEVPSGAQMYILTVIDGCAAPSKTAVIDIKPLPELSFLMDTVLCSKTGLTVENVNIGNTEVVDYTVNWGDGNTNPTETEITTVSHAYPSEGIYLLNIKANATNGCESNFDQNIYVAPKILANFDVNAQEQCLHENNYLAINFDDGGIYPVIHSWDNGVDGYKNQKDFSYHYGAPGPYQIVHATSIGGECPDTVTTSITVLESPRTSFETEEICLGETMTLNNTSQINRKIDSETILIEGLQVHQETSRQSNYTLSFDEAGDFSVSMMQLIGNCGDTFTQTVTVFDLPQVGLEFVLLNERQSIVGLENTSTNNGGNSKYQFGDGVEESKTDLKFEHEYPKPGIYQLILTETSSDGCVNSDTFKIDALGNISFLIPNAYTPDSDGINDQFHFSDPSYVAEFEFSLYDQRNHLVLRSNDPYNPIKEDVNKGTYAYIMVLKDIKGVEHKYEGVLLILK